MHARTRVVNLAVERLLRRPDQHHDLQPVGLHIGRLMRRAGVHPVIVEAVMVAAMHDDMQPGRELPRP